MTEASKKVTALVRSMVSLLSKNHGITVPHSALRAALVQAQGEHPHAFAGKHAKGPSDVTRLQELVREAPAFFAPNYDFDGEKLAWLTRAGLAPSKDTDGVEVTLYLAHDEIGCLTRLSFCQDESMMVPLDWRFSKEAKVLRHTAEVPRISRYGLPVYLENPAGFHMENFGLGVSSQYEMKVTDLGDDSGDSCEVLIRVAESEWLELIQAFLDASPEVSDDIAEWVGLHYRKNFEAESAGEKATWVQRYAEAQDASTELDTPSTVLVAVELFGDESKGLWTKGVLMLDSGTIEFEKSLKVDETNWLKGTVWVDYENPQVTPDIGEGHSYRMNPEAEGATIAWRVSNTDLPMIWARIWARAGAVAS